MNTTLLIEAGIESSIADKVMREVNLCNSVDLEDAVSEAILAHLEDRNPVAAAANFREREKRHHKRCSLEGSLASSSFDAGEQVDSPVERLAVNERIRQRIDSREPIGRPRKMRMSGIVAKAHRIAAELDRKAAQRGVSNAAAA